MSAIPPAVRVAPPLPLDLPGVWQADALGDAPQAVCPTGAACLDAQLPGGGWPVGALSEVLQDRAGQHEWHLVLPALAHATAARSGMVVLVAPPFEPFAPALMAQGVRSERLCLVRPGSAQAAQWAAEQALRCRDVLAVLAWLPQSSPAVLRRLQGAASQQQQLLWVFHPASAAPQASPAWLRLQVRGTVLPANAPAAATALGMQVHILKRRGPPLAQGLELPGCAQRLAQALAAQADRRRAAQAAAAASVWPSRNAGARWGIPVQWMLTPTPTPIPTRNSAEGATAQSTPTLTRRAHAMDRVATENAG